MTTRDDVVYQCGEFLLESANRRFSRNGVEVPLEPKAFAVLLHPHPVADRAQVVSEMEVAGGLDARNDTHQETNLM